MASKCYTIVRRSLALFMLASMLFASEHANPVPESRIVKIAAGEWPPFLSASLPNQGVVAQLIRDVFREAGYDVEFEFVPWARAFAEASEGNYDATAVWMFKEDRTTDFMYSEPVLNEEFVLFHRVDDAFDWSSYDDLKGLLIGGGIGYSYGPEFDAALEKNLFTLIRLETVEQNLRMLSASRTDIFVEEKSVASFTLRQKLPELEGRITSHPKSVLVNQSYLLFSKKIAGNDELMARFNETLIRFKEDGLYKTYFE